MKSLVFVLAAMVAGPVVAQEALPTIEEFFSETSGLEVSATGVFTVPMLQSSIYFQMPDRTMIPVKFALDREKLAAVEQCTDKGDCPAEIKAETQWNSGRLTLVVFDAQVN